MMTIFLAAALQASAGLTPAVDESGRIRFFFADDVRDGDIRASGSDGQSEFSTRAYHDVVKQCGGKRLSAWRNGSHITVSSLSTEQNVALIQCVQASAAARFRMNAVGSHYPGRYDPFPIQPVRTMPIQRQ